MIHYTNIPLQTVKSCTRTGCLYQIAAGHRIAVGLQTAVGYKIVAGHSLGLRIAAGRQSHWTVAAPCRRIVVGLHTAAAWASMPSSFSSAVPLPDALALSNRQVFWCCLENWFVHLLLDFLPWDCLALHWNCDLVLGCCTLVCALGKYHMQGSNSSWKSPSIFVRIRIY